MNIRTSKKVYLLKQILMFNRIPKTKPAPLNEMEEAQYACLMALFDLNISHSEFVRRDDHYNTLLDKEENYEGNKT